MKALGTDMGWIHFVGIGGIGMSGIAEVMHQLGYQVQGSDVAEGYVVEKLRKAGIPVTIGHIADNIGDAAVVVCSTAIKDSNPEIEAAAQRTRRIGRRASAVASHQQHIARRCHRRAEARPRPARARRPPGTASRHGGGVSARPQAHR